MATREELKAILDEWIPKYIRQVVELRSGSRLSAERYNELMNLLITQGDDTIELAETVKQYMEILVDELSNDFVDTTESLTQALNDTTARVTAIAEDAVDTAESAVSSVNQYKTTMDEDMEQFKSTTDADIRNFKNSINTDVEQFKNTVNNTVSQMSSDIVSFKESVTQSIADSDARVNSAVETANQLTADMEAYRTELTQLTEETFANMQTALSQQVSDNVTAGIASLKDELIGDINTTISELEEQVMTIANTAEQAVNSAVQDIEAYKADMDVRLDAALKEVEDSLSVAGEVIQNASAIYAKIDEIDALVKTYEDRLKAVEENTEAGNADTLDGKHADAFAEANHTHNVADVSGTLPVNKGGTGATTAKGAEYNLLNGMSLSEYELTDEDQVVFKYSAPDTSKGVVLYKTALRFWNYIKSKADAVYAKLTHTHTKSQITDFPTSLPASDVYAWAKASSKPTYTWSEITSKPTSFTPTAHTHDDRYYTETETNSLLAGKQANLGFTPVQQGGGTGQGANKVYIGWSGSRLKAMVDQTDMGNFVFDSHLTWGNITGKPTSMPASDVYSWAKASAKPTYAWSEITSKPTSFTPAAHNHSASNITSGTLPIARGGTGATSAKDALTALGGAAVETGTCTMELSDMGKYAVGQGTTYGTFPAKYYKVGNFVYIISTGAYTGNAVTGNSVVIGGLPYVWESFNYGAIRSTPIAHLAVDDGSNNVGGFLGGAESLQDTRNINLIKGMSPYGLQITTDTTALNKIQNGRRVFMCLMFVTLTA